MYLNRLIFSGTYCKINNIHFINTNKSLIFLFLMYKEHKINIIELNI